MKRCGRCKEVKESGAFRKRAAAKDGLSSWCTPCFAKYERERYQNGDSLRKKKNNAIRILRNREFVVNYLLTHPCIDCGETDVRVLDFDHNDATIKTANISIMIFESGASAIKKEIDKCSVRCANCHRKRTAEQFGWWKNRYVEVTI